MLSVVETTAITRKKRSKFLPLAPLVVGMAPLINSMSNPHLAGLRGSDILQLAAIGFCAGVSFSMFVSGGKSSDQG
jgi:hypothetical protein